MVSLRFACLVIAALPLAAQQPIGTVAMQDATVAGDLSVTGGRAVLVGASSVTAKDRTAVVTLARGGTVRVCATSGLHVTQSALPQPAAAKPLMLALDRGAFEIETMALASDVLLTPDLRVSLQGGGPLDLRIRVTSNGDTCVENRGAAAPILNISDAFSGSTYQLRAGQHVLFEHGSLKEVVDHETSPCGCPSAVPAPGMSIAEALLAPGGSDAAAQHPFPAAVSQGLAPPPPVPQAAPGEAHAQVATTLGFQGEGPGSIDGAPVKPAAVPVVPPPPAATPGFGHRVGHFFKRLFGG